MVKWEKLGVFGNDYDTPDGTGVRDYIHVVDLAKGHVKAIDKIQEDCGLKIYNLGTGVGYSVLDIVHNFEKATGVKIPYTIEPRRAGDIVIRQRQLKSLAGKRRTASRRCVRTPGDGSQIIQTVMINKIQSVWTEMEKL